MFMSNTLSLTAAEIETFVQVGDLVKWYDNHYKARIGTVDVLQRTADGDVQVSISGFSFKLVRNTRFGGWRSVDIEMLTSI